MPRLFTLALLGALGTGACSDGNANDVPDASDVGVDGSGGYGYHWTAGAAPDFALLDVNPSSPRFGESVSPRDYLGTISAWFFGWAT